ETQVPGRQRRIAMGISDVTEAARVGVTGPEQEVIEDACQFRGRHALVLDQLQREVVLEPERSRKTIAQRDEIQKAVGQHPPLNLVKGVERTAAAILDGIGRLIDGERAES